MCTTVFYCQLCFYIFNIPLKGFEQRIQIMAHLAHLVPPRSPGDGFLASCLVYRSCIEHKVALLHMLKVCVVFYFGQADAGPVSTLLVQ